MPSMLKTDVNLEQACSDIVTFIRQRLLDDDGVLIMGIRSDGVPNKSRIIDDFGDVAPFIALYGGEDICHTHLQLIESDPSETDFTRAFAYTDLIFGLIWYAKVGTHSELARSLAVNLAEKAYQKWSSDRGFSSVEYKGLVLPIANGIDTTYLEVWTEMYRLTNDPKWLERAEWTFDFWKKIQDSNPKQLIPVRTVATKSGMMQTLLQHYYHPTRIMKDNTNYGFGLLDLYRCTKRSDCKEAFDRLVSTLSLLVQQEAFTNRLPSGSGRCIELLPTFAYVDVLCDAYQLIGEDSYRSNAILLADYWLKKQNTKTGLFPKTSTSTNSYFDSETDMGVALLKLYECTHDEKYLLSVSKLIAGLYEFHYQQEYALEVDVQTGSVKTKNIKTKFVALAIKLLHLAQSDSTIYTSDNLFMLAKDR
ncbi:hypothetical protein N9L26_01740 [Candidatus Pacebacteria bacterium]|nr:hypothetical protein [Candidatus Paceibacterota bacterium]